MKRALLSVSDKTGIVEFARGLQELGFELIASDGTRAVLKEAGLKVRTVEELTGLPAILGGRVKTLHSAIHAGILVRRDLPEQLAEVERLGIEPIDLVAVNLYPFQQVAREKTAEAEVLEAIDIGGPALLRAAAKNYTFVLPVCDPADYPAVLEFLRGGGSDPAFRRRLAAKAFEVTAAFDALVAEYLLGDEPFPDRLVVALERAAILRYGENPHQPGALYRLLTAGPDPVPNIAAARQLWGKELSFNNYLDLDAALSLVAEFTLPTVAIIKHTNPCGVASADTLAEAYRRAHAGDPVSAYGGIIGANRVVDAETAQAIRPFFYEAIVAPGYDEEALEVLKRKRDLRIMVAPLEPAVSSLRSELELRRISGGYLVQTVDRGDPEDLPLKVVTERQPTLEELTEMLFAWRVVRHVKSNAIVITRNQMLVGLGAGQPNRVASVDIALRQAGDRAHGAVLASDAFFPFPDGVEHAAIGGVTAIIQPGGSIRDEEVIRVANRHRIAMVFTGRRHFKH